MPRGANDRPDGPPVSRAIDARDVRLGGSWTLAQRARNDAIYAAASVALAVATRLPRSLVKLACEALGDVAWAAWPAARRRVDRNLSLALGASAPDSRAVFRGLADTLADTLALLGGEAASAGALRLDDDDRAALRSARSEGRGVILATAHLGPWERVGALIVEEGFALCTLARRSYDPRFDRLYERLRQRRGLDVVYRGEPGAGRAVVRALRARKIVGFPLDLGGRGVRVHPAPWPGGRIPLAMGPAELAVRTSAPVVVATPFPEPSGGLRLLVTRIDVRAEGSAQPSAEALTEAIGRELSRRVRALPTRWPWMHLDVAPLADFPHDNSLLRPGNGHR